MPDGEIIFDAPSKIDHNFKALMDMYPAEQQETMRAALMEALKEWWEKAPQNKKDEVITALKTPAKPKGREWSDLEAWRGQLNDREKEEACNDFGASSDRNYTQVCWGRWTLKDANDITKWDNRIAVIDQFPLYRGISRHPALSADIRQFLEHSDKRGGSNIVHVRV